MSKNLSSKFLVAGLLGHLAPREPDDAEPGDLERGVVELRARRRLIAQRRNDAQ